MELSESFLWRLAGEALATALRAAPGYEAHLTPDAALILSGEPVADLNLAIIDDGPFADERLRTFHAIVRQHDLPVLMIFTTKVADRLAPIAAELGLQYAGTMPLMVYQPSTAPAPASSYEIEHVTIPAALHESNVVAARAFSLPLDVWEHACGPALLDSPGLDIFLARREGTPVSTVWTTRAGPIVGIWCMGTPVEHQRQGAGRALLEYAIAYQYARGATTFYLGATAAGKPLYDHVGFRTLAESPVWVAGNSTQVGGHG